MMNEGPQTPPPGALREVRYSLRMLLEELKEEQKDSVFGQEMVDQDEIVKLFARKRKKRGGIRTK